MTISLAGKRILGAGAPGAVGGAVVEAARECGAWVAGSYFKDEDEAGRLRAQGIVMEQADLTDRAQARALVDRVAAEGPLDALVYTAGNTKDHTLLKLIDEEWDQVLRLHLDGLMACSQQAVRSMRDRRGSKIVAIGSMSGLTGRAGQTNYSAAKAGTVGFIKALAREVGRLGITANGICPGFVDSKMTRSSPPEAWERARTDSALGILSSVEVVASFTTWLLSDLCHGVTGQIFNLDSRIL